MKQKAVSFCYKAHSERAVASSGAADGSAMAALVRNHFGAVTPILGGDDHPKNGKGGSQ